MRKSTIKSLLLGLLMTAGASSAWAAAGDVTTNVDIDFSNAISEGVVAGTKNSMAIGEGSATYISDGWLRLCDGTNTITIPESDYAGDRDVVTVSFKMAWGNKNSMGSSFKFKDSEGEYIATFQFARWDGKSSNGNTLGIEMSGLYGAAWNNAPILDRATTFTISIDYSKKTITSVVSCTNPNASKTFTVGFDNTYPLASIEFSGYGVGGNTDRADALDNVKVVTTEGNYDAVSANYTVNYICGDNTIKSEVRTGDVGSEIVLLGDDTSDQTINGTKYIYIENNAEGKTIASDGSTVVTIKYREAEEWNYSIKAMAGEEELVVLTTGKVLEGDVVNYGYSQYLAIDGVLYMSNKQSSNPWWGGSFTPTADNEIVTINYTAEGTTGVVFCEEGENISTLTPVTGGNTDIRASNRAGGYAASNAVITTLPAGTYKLCAATYGNAGTTFRFNAGGVTVLEIATNGNPVHTESEEFTLNGTVDIIVPQAGSAGTSPKTIDYIYIVKTGDVEETAEIIPVTTDAGWTTYVTKNAIEIPSNIEAYTVDAFKTEGDVKTGVTLSAVEKVPAGTPIIVKAAKGNYDCNIVASAEEPAFKFLKASDGSVVGDGTIYALANINEVVGFYPVKAGIAVPAGKAYIVVEKEEAPVKGYLALGDEADAINNIAVEAANGAIYNIAGQKMESMKNGGLYIVNGKKVIVK